MEKRREIRESLEKIGKAILVKIDNGDELSVSEEIIWYDNLIDRIYQLLNSDSTLFFEIVDPLGVFKNVKKPGLRKTNWSRVKVKEGIRNSHRKSYQISVAESQYDLVDSFFSFSFHIWEAGVTSENTEHLRRAIYLLGNLYGIVSMMPAEHKLFNSTKYFEFFSQKLSVKLGGLLSNRRYSEDNNSFITHIAFHYGLDHLAMDELPKPNVELISGSFFRNLRLLVSRGQLDLIKTFIRSASHRNLFPLNPNIGGRLAIMASAKIDDESVREKFSDEIFDLTISANNIFTIGDLADVELSVSRHNQEAKRIFQPLSDEEISRLDGYFSEEIEYALKMYKYRQVQRALNYTLIYCIFQNKFDIIDFAFRFHNPSDNTATWANQDIILGGLFEILTFADNGWETETSLMFDWPDHHGVTPYIDIYVVALLNRWALNHSPDETAYAGVDRFLRSAPKNPDQIRSWQKVLSDYTAIALRRRSLALWPFEKSNGDSFDRLIQALESINNAFEVHLE